MADFWKGASEALPLGAQMGMHFLGWAREDKRYQQELEIKNKDVMLNFALKMEQVKPGSGNKILKQLGFPPMEQPEVPKISKEDQQTLNFLEKIGLTKGEIKAKYTVPEGKPSALEQKLDLALKALMLPDGHPLKQPLLRMSGAASPAASSLWGKIFELNPDITITEIIKIRNQMAKGTKSGKSMTTLEAYSKAVIGKTPHQATPEEMDTVLKRLVKDKKWSVLGALLMGEEGQTQIQQLETGQKDRLRQLMEIADTRDLTEAEQAEFTILWGQQKGK
jgi:hypothetical protein